RQRDGNRAGRGFVFPRCRPSGQKHSKLHEQRQPERGHGSQATSSHAEQTKATRRPTVSICCASQKALAFTKFLRGFAKKLTKPSRAEPPLAAPCTPVLPGLPLFRRSPNC